MLYCLIHYGLLRQISPISYMHHDAILPYYQTFVEKIDVLVTLSTSKVAITLKGIKLHIYY